MGSGSEKEERGWGSDWRLKGWRGAQACCGGGGGSRGLHTQAGSALSCCHPHPLLLLHYHTPPPPAAPLTLHPDQISNNFCLPLPHGLTSTKVLILFARSLFWHYYHQWIIPQWFHTRILPDLESCCWLVVLRQAGVLNNEKCTSAPCVSSC